MQLSEVSYDSSAKGAPNDTRFLLPPRNLEKKIISVLQENSAELISRLNDNSFTLNPNDINYSDGEYGFNFKLKSNDRNELIVILSLLPAFLVGNKLIFRICKKYSRNDDHLKALNILTGFIFEKLDLHPTIHLFATEKQNYFYLVFGNPEITRVLDYGVEVIKFDTYTKSAALNLLFSPQNPEESDLMTEEVAGTKLIALPDNAAHFVKANCALYKDLHTSQGSPFQLIQLYHLLFNKQGEAIPDKQTDLLFNIDRKKISNLPPIGVNLNAGAFYWENNDLSHILEEYVRKSDVTEYVLLYPFYTGETYSCILEFKADAFSAEIIKKISIFIKNFIKIFIDNANRIETSLTEDLRKALPDIEKNSSLVVTSYALPNRAASARSDDTEIIDLLGRKMSIM
jgi:hypothetical protein